MSPTKNPVVTLVLPVDLLEKVEDFRFGHRFPNRSQAVVWLLAAALEAGLKPKKG